jgi:glutamate racemase
MGAEPILFFDSGAGGLPYLAMMRERLPREGYVYVADRRNYPYGEKTAAELRTLVVQSVGLALRRFAPKLVVVACNTASVVALEALRAAYAVPFVGVVPAVKPAARELAGGRLAVVATRRTVSGRYLRQLIQDFAPGLDVLTIPVRKLVDYAEFAPPPRRAEEDEAIVRRELAPYLGRGLGAVVLGCTHFTLLEESFRRVLGAGVRLIDSRDGVTRRAVSLLEAKGLLSPEQAGEADRGGTGEARLFLHGGAGDRERYGAFARAFALELAGELDPENMPA